VKVSEAAAAMGKKGGSVSTPAKRAAVRRNLEKARKSRWPDGAKKTAK